MTTPPNSSHPTSLEALKVCPTCQGEGKLFCAICGEWGNHRSGGCPAIPHNKPEILKAQADKSEERANWFEDDTRLSRYKEYLNDREKYHLNPCAASAFNFQEQHYQPIVEALKAEVEELRSKRINQERLYNLAVDNQERWMKDCQSLRKQIEQLTSRLTLAESISAKAEITANKLLKAQEQIEQLKAEVERAQQTNKAYESLKALEGHKRQTP